MYFLNGTNVGIGYNEDVGAGQNKESIYTTITLCEPERKAAEPEIK